ncbi:uncharacterized protein LOC132647141 isoform X2 [Meriones unguiculatus]|uniref:uncharacterized protein LOC132647141 isoform X2 n=1 Tax=Meriones unguiculatus TaxID=10047 RepID=UPI00293F2A0D|nr:uncharacterized protein LOC132647141 isoform X2 [Meriones unguiculatus]
MTPSMRARSRLFPAEGKGGGRKQLRQNGSEAAWDREPAPPSPPLPERLMLELKSSCPKGWECVICTQSEILGSHITPWHTPPSRDSPGPSSEGRAPDSQSRVLALSPTSRTSVSRRPRHLGLSCDPAVCTRVGREARSACCGALKMMWRKLPAVGSDFQGLLTLTASKSLGMIFNVSLLPSEIQFPLLTAWSDSFFLAKDWN